jgi:hypothetical protein
MWGKVDAYWWCKTPFLKLTKASPKNKEMLPKSTQGKFLTPELANPHTKQKEKKMNKS